MHVPKVFEITDPEIIAQFIKENGFGTLISRGEKFPIGTHIPMQLEINSQGERVLLGHVSKENPQWIDFEKSPKVLAIFLSPIHHYISSSWYKKPNTPTWNYISIHLSGTLKTIEGDALWQSLSRLTDNYEAKMSNPFSLETTTKAVQRQINGIVGFEIRIEKTEASFKLSQNRSEEDFENIIKQLQLSASLGAQLMADAMKRQQKTP
jgi:transcriptional regulator